MMMEYDTITISPYKSFYKGAICISFDYEKRIEILKYGFE